MREPDSDYVVFVRVNHDRFLRRCAHFVGPTHALDLLQDVMIHTLRRWDTLSTDDAARVAWVYEVIRTRGWRMSLVLRRKRTKNIDDFDRPETPQDGQALIAATLVEACLDAVGHDSADAELLLLLAAGEDRAEIAEILGVSRGTLRVRVHRLRTTLRSHGIHPDLGYDRG